MTDLRIGIIGLGGICRTKHVPGFRKVSGVQLCAVANRTRPSSERAARDFGITRVCDVWQEIIGSDDIDAVLIGTWPYMHCDLSVAALEAGKHVFCQARMARDRAEAERMAAAAAASDKVAALCPVPIGMRVDRVIARMLGQGVLGNVRHVSVRSFANTWCDPDAPVNWRKDHRLSGLNMHTLGMYIEVVHRWFGWTQRVSAETFIYTPQRPVPDGAPLEIRIPDQMFLNTVVSADLPVHYEISCVSGIACDTIDIYGDKGALHYDVNGDVLYHDEDGTRTPVTILPEEHYDLENWRVEQEFVDAVRGGVAYHPNFEDGLRYMRVIQAAYDSAASGRQISL